MIIVGERINSTGKLAITDRLKAPRMQRGRDPGWMASLSASRRDRLNLDSAPPAGGRPA